MLPLKHTYFYCKWSCWVVYVFIGCSATVGLGVHTHILLKPPAHTLVLLFYLPGTILCVLNIKTLLILQQTWGVCGHHFCHFREETERWHHTPRLWLPGSRQQRAEGLQSQAAGFMAPACEDSAFLSLPPASCVHASSHLLDSCVW